MKKFFGFLLIITLSVNIYGQSDTSVSFKNKCVDNFQLLYFGIQIPEIKELNNILKIQDFPTLSKYQPLIGIGALRFDSKFVKGFNISGFQLCNKNDSLSVCFRSLSEEFSIGLLYF